MTLDDAISAFAAPGNEIPFAAMEAALAQWDAAGPRCLAMLDDYVHGRDRSEKTERSLFILVHLLGEKCETAAFANLCTWPAMRSGPT